MRDSWVVDFTSGRGSERDLLGGKGAGLAEMSHIGLRVPPGFTVTADACRHVMRTGKTPQNIWNQVDSAVRRLEEASNRQFGSGPSPLLVSVRSGAKFSMPGMMDTVLNLGINDSILETLTEWSRDPHFSHDAYRRFIQMYADVVLGVDPQPFQEVLSSLRDRRGVPDDSGLEVADLIEAITQYKKIIAGEGLEVPDDPWEQLHTAIAAVFNSWNNPRAKSYRRINFIDDNLGTAANVQMMVFGDLGADSGTGVCFTRDPATGENAPFGDYLPRAQGEDVVSGTRNALHLDALKQATPQLHEELVGVMNTLEQHTHDMCDIEFTIERGKLWILQTRAGKRTAAAAVRMAVEMVAEGLIDKETAVMRVNPGQLEQLQRPRLGEVGDSIVLGVGVAASPGAAQGIAVFDAARAVEARAAGKVVVLIRPETTPDDIDGMHAAEGILTSQGGKTSHAAVVARGMGKPAVTAVSAMSVDVAGRKAIFGDFTLEEGDQVTIDGTTGTAYAGLLQVVQPRATPELATLLEWADGIRTLGVWANADTPEDAATARENGAEGIGLARTEHMFMGERLEIVQRVILAESEDVRADALLELRDMQKADFSGLLEAMDGLPVIVRLLDPPLHEFLPSRHEIKDQMIARLRVGEPTDDLEELEAKVRVWEEDNPMLGLRGVRLGLMMPGLYEMQVRAAIDAVVDRLEVGGDPQLELMIPLVSLSEELVRMREMITKIILETEAARQIKIHVPIGTMIEIPRAALTAGKLAGFADFFSFGTNDLTQMTFGLSRDDAEGLFLRDYVERQIMGVDVFQTIDSKGVGQLIRMAVTNGREANPRLTIGVCGEHGGDPASIAFCREVGLDYVSCSPPRVHVARLAAAQAELSEITRDV